MLTSCQTAGSIGRLIPIHVASLRVHTERHTFGYPSLASAPSAHPPSRLLTLPGSPPVLIRSNLVFCGPGSWAESCVMLLTSV